MPTIKHCQLSKNQKNHIHNHQKEINEFTEKIEEYKIRKNQYIILNYYK
jgi:hypothetical protein